MSGVPEAAAVMTSRDLFTVGPAVSTGPTSSQPQLDQQMRVPYTTDGAYRPVGSPQPYQSISGGGPVMKHGMNLNSGDQKRKRGRPRKYGMAAMAMTMASAPQPISVGMQQTQSFSPSAAATQTESQPPVGGSASPTAKARGRPPGSSNKKKQMEAIGNMGYEIPFFNSPLNGKSNLCLEKLFLYINILGLTDLREYGKFSYMYGGFSWDLRFQLTLSYSLSVPEILTSL
ncbi:UNVERIFIED_CONTAM: hypothetical protein Slati_0837500 [Sesamum latifolium]|uniref:AT-hook motif nuclear-localized protein n=1 Tax=Sesamum latifolium TaxID=2727402 RepID=A0AAW2XM96_9LAMI